MAGWRGYVQLDRALVDSPVFQDDGLWRLYCWCLVRANYSDSMLPNGEVIPRGSFSTGRLIIAEVMQTSDATAYRRLQKLKSLGLIDLKSNNKYTTVTILNYDSYVKSYDRQDNESNNRETTNDAPAARVNGQQMTAPENTVKTDNQITIQENKNNTPQLLQGFSQAFAIAWERYPARKRVEKVTASAAWNEAAKLIAGRNGGIIYKAEDWLLKRLIEFCKSPLSRSRYCPNLGRWLEAGRYDDDPAAWQSSDDDGKPEWNGRSSHGEMPIIPRG